MSKEYWLDPSDVKFDSKMSGFNEQKTPEEYEALKYQIRRGVQEDPILIRNGLCGDGVHRTRIAKELGRKVLAVDVDPELSDKDFILRCNKNTFASRNLSATQKAIKAYRLTTEFGYSDAEAIKNAGLPKGTKSIGYVRTIANSQMGKDLDVLHVLEQGNSITINGKVTKSIDNAKRAIKLYEEAELRAKVDENMERVRVDYNEHLTTETGKDLFWAMQKLEKLPRNLKLIELINTIYKAPKDAEGEIE